MSWQIAAAIAGVAMGVAGAGQTRAAGQVARTQARLQAIEIRKQRFGLQEQALQTQQQRLEQFEDLVNTNAAFAAFMGRSDRSIRALQKQEARKYSTDVRRIQAQAQREIDKLNLQARTEEQRGESAKQIASYNANAQLVSTIGSAAMLYGTSGSNPSSTSTSTTSSTAGLGGSPSLNLTNPGMAPTNY
tara:strand:+ start:4666 stop:5232 length:567 start_codon:yes stop_codon:yes gene_type:complete